ncbi:M12 family metallopeptidase [Kitasatospora sp. NPDC094019]|uniref:M12 family metallopeptidase n=1 Tax=Kitasatospora sp. NPDC094019 TaxID=3364091 RepID=UPI0038025DEF
MAIRRSFARCAVSALLLAALAGPLGPSAHAADPDPNDPEGTVLLESLGYQAPDLVTAEVSYSCEPDTAQSLVVGFEQELDFDEEAAGSAEVEDITCDGTTCTVTVDIPVSEGGADFEEPLAGQVVIVLTGDDLPVVENDFAVDEGGRPRALGRADKKFRWKKATVPYVVDPKLTKSQKSDVKAAIDHWEQKTPIRFVVRTAGNARSYPDYAVELVHEIGHTVGLYHEQERPDRDTYVTVSFENIEPADKHNFQIQKGESTFGTAYDYASIMHYGPKSYSKNGKDTITPKQKLPAGLVLGGTTELSAGDIAAVKAMYK